MNKSAIGIFEEFAEEYLNFEHTPVKNIFWLDTMEFLCRRFGHPETKCRTIHVAGSKGKGSLSKMIAYTLEKAGYKTGLYSSPHILNFNERIGSANGPFEEEVYEKSVKELIEKVKSIKNEELPGGRPITWFELVTMLGILCFKNAGCDFAVYEVGLGGRLDATNVIKPEICCINQIEKEHTEFLGDTIEKIAAEKGGIIKENIPVIISPFQCESVKKVFHDIAEEKKAPIIFVENISKVSQVVQKSRQKTEDFILSSDLFSRNMNFHLKMPGKFQQYNAATACIVLKKLINDLDEGLIEEAINNVTLSGRFEIQQNIKEFPGIVSLIMDGAHTVNSVGFTMETFERFYGNEKKHLLFGCAADKDVEGMTGFFKGKFSDTVITKPGSVKESDISRMKKAFDSAEIEYTSCNDYIKAVKLALEKADRDNAVLLVTGSFYLVSEVKKYLISLKCTQST